MHNKTVKRRVNRRIGGSPRGTNRKRKPSPSPELSSIPHLEKKAKKIRKGEEEIYRLLPRNKRKIHVGPNTTPIPESNNESNYIKKKEENGPDITSKDISDSPDSVSSNESGPSGTPLFVRRPRDPKKSKGNTKKRKYMEYISKVIKSSDDSFVGKKRGRIVPVFIEHSKDDGDLLHRRVRKITVKKQKPVPQNKKFNAPKNVSKPPPPPQKILKVPKTFVPPQAPKKLPKRIVALRLYNYYRDKTLENNKKDPNRYLDYICHIRCKDGFMYTIDSDIERTIISNGPVEFDFSYRCQHVPFNIKRENACKVCSHDFEVNADYFKYLNNMTHRPKDEKTEYLEFVNSLTKEEDIYEFFLLLGNVIEFLTDEHSSTCDTTNVTY